MDKKDVEVLKEMVKEYGVYRVLRELESLCWDFLYQTKIKGWKAVSRAVERAAEVAKDNFIS